MTKAEVSSPTHSEVEQRIRALIDTKNLTAAATLAIESYGPEVLGFLFTLLRDEHDAREVFSQACEDLWVGLPRFEGRSSFRTWFYGKCSPSPVLTVR
jgi:RNA polymerase sigma-70 factor (ECF subfamily)